MRDAQKPNHVGLSTLVTHLRDGRYVIPDFQRDFEWEPWDISALMRSIFLDYYIGSLLLWKGKAENFDALACEAIYGYKGKNGSPDYIVLDGQQRLTAMYYAFMSPDVSAPKRYSRYRYFVRVDKFMEEAMDDAFTYDWTRRGEILAKDPERQFQDHMFPLSVIGKEGWALADWVRDYEKYWETQEKRAVEKKEADAKSIACRNLENARLFGDHLRSITHQYQVSYIELDVDLELEKVCDIFTQINSRGVRLDIFDLINALLRPKGLQLRHMWRDAEQRLDFVNSDRLNVYVLQVMSILGQAYCSPKYLYNLLPGHERQFRDSEGTLRREMLVPDSSTFEQLWDQAVDSLEFAIKLLRHPQQFGAIASRYLPYVSILPAFAALQTETSHLPDYNQLDAQRKIRQWYWASVFLNRYSGAVESTTARDFLDVKDWFANENNEPTLISEFRERFRSIDLLRETRRGTSVYNGIFNLLVLNGARDWITSHAPQHDDLDDHHIVPRAWGRQRNIEEVDSILNRTPLSANTNRNAIGNRLPNKYLPELIANSGEDMVREILESHLISPVALDILLRDPFTPEDFREFLGERQRTIREAIEDLLIKARLDLPPRLRRIDSDIESVELGIRQFIVRTLEDDAAVLPQHIQKKIGDRLQQAVRRTPALDLNSFHALSARLEYADIRELEDILATKALWGYFEDSFKSKEQLAIRFDQLAQLRNSIRHSRQVDEITLKDGEAAILWFCQVLS